jgi:hypothetical protein
MREVFVLRDVEGLSTAEVAESLDVSEDVVKTRLSRGRAALRRALLDRTGRQLRRPSGSTGHGVTVSSSTFSPALPINASDSTLPQLRLLHRHRGRCRAMKRDPPDG